MWESPDFSIKSNEVAYDIWKKQSECIYNTLEVLNMFSSDDTAYVIEWLNSKLRSSRYRNLYSLHDIFRIAHYIEYGDGG